MTLPFALDPRLEHGSVVIAELPLSVVRLVDDARFPWLLLIPQVAGAVDLIDLDGKRPRGADRGDRRRLERAEGGDQLYQAQRRRARQPGAAASHPRHRALCP